MAYRLPWTSCLMSTYRFLSYNVLFRLSGKIFISLYLVEVIVITEMGAKSVAPFMSLCFRLLISQAWPTLHTIQVHI